MKFTGLTPTLFTRDIRGSVDFYVSALGFEHDGPDGSGVAFVRRDDAAWLAAVIELDTSRLELGGDLSLAKALLEGLHWALLLSPRLAQGH